MHCDLMTKRVGLLLLLRWFQVLRLQLKHSNAYCHLFALKRNRNKDVFAMQMCSFIRQMAIDLGSSDSLLCPVCSCFQTSV